MDSERAIRNRRLATYAAVAAAGACSTAVTSRAEAAIVYSGALNYSVPVSTAGVYYDLVDFTKYASLSAAQTAEGTSAPLMNLWGTTNTFCYLYPSSSTINRAVSGSTAALVGKLPAGITVGPASSYATSRAPGALTTGDWASGDTAYIGVRFLSGAATLYGWVEIKASAPPSAGSPIILIDSAYEDSGLPIVTGDRGGVVPEPGSLGLLAAGAMAALGWRRRQLAA